MIIPTCKAFQCGYCLATNDPKWVSLNPRGPQSPLTRLSPLLLFWYDKTLTQRQQSHAQDTAFPTDCLIYGEQCMSPGESFNEWPPWPSKLLSTWNFQSAEMKRIRWSNFISKILIYYYYFFLHSSRLTWDFLCSWRGLELWIFPASAFQWLGLYACATGMPGLCGPGGWSMLGMLSANWVLHLLLRSFDADAGSLRMGTEERAVRP